MVIKCNLIKWHKTFRLIHSEFVLDHQSADPTLVGTGKTRGIQGFADS